MKFDLTEDQRLLRDQVARFLQRECPQERVQAIFDSDSGFDKNLWDGLMALGLGGLVVPEDYGGLGLELLDLAVISEELGHAATPGPFLGHVLAGLAIALAGSERQKKEWLPKIAAGEIVAGLALGEADNRWLPDQWQVAGTATLRGEKRNVICAPETDLFVVGLEGGALALVYDQEKALAITSPEVTDRSRRVHHVDFTGAFFEPLAGAEAENIRAAAWRLVDAGLCLLAADAHGGARHMLGRAVAYAQEREQFGVTIAHFQAVKHQLADMAILIEPNFALYWYAAHAFDHVPDERARLAAIAKAHLAECYSQVCRQAIEIHGGIGYTWEYPAQIWLKRSLFDWAYLGTPPVHRRRAAKLAGW